jgi:hypothetical protein
MALSNPCKVSGNMRSPRICWMRPMEGV